MSKERDDRILGEMAAELAKDDPKFARTMQEGAIRLPTARNEKTLFRRKKKQPKPEDTLPPITNRTGRRLITIGAVGLVAALALTLWENIDNTSASKPNVNPSVTTSETSKAPPMPTSGNIYETKKPITRPTN